MSEGKLADWVKASEAHKLVRRDRKTVYRWISSGRVKSMQPGTIIWAYIPDLLKVEAETTRRIKRESN